MSAAVPRLPPAHPDQVTSNRRVAETVNNILGFKHDDSRIQTAAEVAAGVTPVNYAYAPGDVRRYGAKGDDATDDTLALQSWLNVGLQGTPLQGHPFTCKIKASISGMAAASVLVHGNGMTIHWAAQTSADAEVFRINTTTAVDVTVRNLKVQGGRTTSGIGNGSAPFASGIAIYGTTAQNAGTVIIEACQAQQTFYVGIEAHFAENVRILRCVNVFHNAYAGIMVTDAVHTTIDGNQVDDSGNTMITDGYGITSATSYSTSTSGWNDTVVICNNLVTSSKRKGIDCHSGLSVKIFGNKVVGFGNSGIYAICEDAFKEVRDVQIFGNTVVGKTAFVTSASGAAVDIGAFGNNLAQQPSFVVRDNKVIDLVATYGVSLTNSTTASVGDVQSVDIHSNQFESCTFDILVFTNNNTPGRYRSINVSYNSAVLCTLNTEWMALQKYDNCNVFGNTLAACTVTSNLIAFDDTSKVGSIGDNLVDGVLTNLYRKQSFTAAVVDGGTITHGMTITPLSVIACGSVAANIVSVTAIGSGTFTVSIKTGAGAPGTTQTIYWQAQCL